MVGLYWSSIRIPLHFGCTTTIRAILLIRCQLRTAQSPLSNTNYFSKLVRLPTIPYFHLTGKAAFAIDSPSV